MAKRQEGITPAQARRSYAPETPATAEAIAAQTRPGRVKVRVKLGEMCWYGEERKRSGDVFTISADRYPDDYTYNATDHPQFTKTAKAALYGKPHPKAGQLKELSQAMEVLPAGDRSPERTTGAQEALASQMKSKRPDASAAKADDSDDVLT